MVKAVIGLFTLVLAACATSPQHPREACSGDNIPFMQVRWDSFDAVCFHDAVVYVGFHEGGIASLESVTGDGDLVPFRMGFDPSCLGVNSRVTKRMHERLMKTNGAVISGTGYVRTDGVFMVRCVFDIKSIKLTDRQKVRMSLPP
jgi:hypothetical protein